MSMAKAETKGKPGQPTKYKPEYCEAIIDFYDQEPWEEKEGKRLYQRRPSVNGFAKHIKACVASVYNWKTKDHDSFHPEFLEAWNTAKALSKDWLIDVGLSGLAPANSFKFVAVNCTDMRDKVETIHGATTELQTVLGLINGQNKGKLPKDDDKDTAGAS